MCTLSCTLDGNATTANSERDSVDIVESNVPQSAMDAFRASFVYEDGHFRGAQIDMLMPYMTSDEIRDLVSTFITDPSISVLYEQYKPKNRGCKLNWKWHCVLVADDVKDGPIP